MNRDELLTRLAMGLAEWPAEMTMPAPPIRGVWTNHGEWKCYAKGDNRAITRGDYLAERERLINKPSWKDAPDNTVSVAQNDDGKWVWYLAIPKIIGDAYWGCRAGGRHASHGEIPTGHDWRQTLEKRPDSSISTSSDDIAVSEHEDDAFRECERRLREAELLRDITPTELVNNQLVQRCEELQESNARLVDENQRLRRAFREYCA